MKLLGSTENKITKDKNGENVPHLEITEVLLVHCVIAYNNYQQDSRVLYTLIQNKPFGSLLEISPTNHIFLKTFNSQYDEIIVWFIGQNSQPIEDRINLTMVVKWRLRVETRFHLIKKRYLIEPRDVKRKGCLSFAKNMGKSLSKKYD